jgi:hypothetical protein
VLQNLGRFLQRDPLGYKKSMNPYEYAFNNPIRFNDITGLDAVESNANQMGYSKKLERTNPPGDTSIIPIDYYVVGVSGTAMFGVGFTYGLSIVITKEGKIGVYTSGPPDPKSPINTIGFPPSLGGSVTAGFGTGLKNDLQKYEGIFHSVNIAVGEGPQGVVQYSTS